jgi:hypothetical protein
MSDIKNISANKIKLTLIQSNDGMLRVEARIEEESVWLTQAQVAELFGKDGGVAFE